MRIEHTAFRVVGGQSKVVEAVQDEASPTPLPGEPPKAKNLLLGEGQSLLRAHFSKAQEPCRHHLRDGRAQTVAAGRELAKRAEDETHGGVCVRSVKGAELQELCLDRPHHALHRPVALVVQRASYLQVLLWHKRRALLDGVVLPIPGIFSTEGEVFLPQASVFIILKLSQYYEFREYAPVDSITKEG